MRGSHQEDAHAGETLATRMTMDCRGSERTRIMRGNAFSDQGEQMANEKILSGAPRL